MIPNCHNGAHSPAGSAPPMQEPTYCQMNANRLTVAQCTPPAPYIRRGPSLPHDRRLHGAEVRSTQDRFSRNPMTGYSSARMRESSSRARRTRFNG